MERMLVHPHVKVSLRADLYMTHEDHVFVIDVVVMDSTQEMVAMSVISRLVGAIAELIAIIKIRKYRGIHEGHHIIPMAMEVHDTPKRDMDCFIRVCAFLIHNR